MQCNTHYFSPHEDNYILDIHLTLAFNLLWKWHDTDKGELIRAREKGWGPADANYYSHVLKKRPDNCVVFWVRNCLKGVSVSDFQWCGITLWMVLSRREYPVDNFDCCHWYCQQSVCLLLCKACYVNSFPCWQHGTIYCSNIFSAKYLFAKYFLFSGSLNCGKRNTLSYIHILEIFLNNWTIPLLPFGYNSKSTGSYSWLPESHVIFEIWMKLACRVTISEGCLLGFDQVKCFNIDFIYHFNITLV